jgi:sugar lactone lactonase YvrE
MVAHDIYTIAGTGACGSSGDSGPALSAQLWTPVSVAVDGRGDVFISDQGAGAVLELAVTSGTYYGTAIAAGSVNTVVGAGLYGTYVSDGLSATFGGAGLKFPDGLAVDAKGDLFIADTYDRCIREVRGVTGTSFGRAMTVGDMYTVAGAVPGNAQYAVAPAAAAQMVYPTGVAVSPSGGVLYFSDIGTNEVRRVGAPGAS